ncbi:MAG: serine hydrolase [Deltaproteobacteria bacterium]|nr:serine hydrolase [Deltaproteobacteria bacterium]MBW2413371.1 serine hydrolase [Deltaproteobacteria bacterium]
MTRANTCFTCLLALLLAAFVGPGTSARADQPARNGDVPVPADPLLQALQEQARDSPARTLAQLWDYRSDTLQAQVGRALAQLGLDREVREGDLSVVLVDATDPNQPRVAEFNGDEMMYAASLPKIAVLLAAFQQIAGGEMQLDDENEQLMIRMIRRSDNAATTELMHRVGKENIARILLSVRYRLYDPRHGGGLWVGKDYGKAGLWRRDPLNNLSHGATAMQVARFYFLLENEQLVTPEHSRKMKEILSHSALNHKFVSGLRRSNPDARFFRKSGSWRTYHSDSVLVKRDGRTYIAVALANDPGGADWLSEIIEALDEIVFPGPS